MLKMREKTSGVMHFFLLLSAFKSEIEIMLYRNKIKKDSKINYSI